MYTHFVFSGVNRLVAASSISNITPIPTLNIRPLSTGPITDDFNLVQEALHPLIKEVKAIHPKKEETSRVR